MKKTIPILLLLTGLVGAGIGGAAQAAVSYRRGTAKTIALSDAHTELPGVEVTVRIDGPSPCPDGHREARFTLTQIQMAGKSLPTLGETLTGMIVWYFPSGNEETLDLCGPRFRPDAYPDAILGLN